MHANLFPFILHFCHPNFVRMQHVTYFTQCTELHKYLHRVT
jgi:hypothetical protein